MRIPNRTSMGAPVLYKLLLTSWRWGGGREQENKFLLKNPSVLLALDIGDLGIPLQVI